MPGLLEDSWLKSKPVSTGIEGLSRPNPSVTQNIVVPEKFFLVRSPSNFAQIFTLKGIREIDHPI